MNPLNLLQKTTQSALWLTVLLVCSQTTFVASDEAATGNAAGYPLATMPGQVNLQGHGFQTSLIAGPNRRFAQEGIHAQSILIDPALKLVVHTAVGKDARGDASDTHIGAEHAALWRGIVNYYGKW